MTLATLLLASLLTQTPPPPPPSSLSPPSREVPTRGEASKRSTAAVPPAVLRAAFEGDPPPAYLRNAATALALAEPGRAHSLVERARWAALLPELRVRVDRRLARTESLDLGRSASDPLASPVGVDSINDMRYELRATWDLGRIVFNPDEVGASTHALRMAEVRREIETVVIRLYFERRRLKAEALASDASDTTPGVRVEIHIQELEAELDALTGGAFSRWRTSRAGESSATP
jgi:hypothetical protein